MSNPEVRLSLDQAVAEVLARLTGQELAYDPASDRYHTIARTINRSMREVALEHEWSYYSDVEELAEVRAGDQDFELNSRQRPRIVNDDAIRLNDSNGVTRVWGYFLPRDALHKYIGRSALYAAVTRSTITLSRPIQLSEDGYRLFIPVMREPKMFDIPADGSPVLQRTRDQWVDFDYPDLVVARAAWLYAQTDPVFQPRVQTLEMSYKDLMYQLIERDDRHTDTPYMNEFTVPILGSLNGPTFPEFDHPHPHADERWR